MQEVEAKFYVMDLVKIESRLRELHARLIQQRVLETNIRFDLPNSRLRSEGRVLRLRQDTEARLTYKDASKSEQGVLSRTEIEFTVEDFHKAKQFLEALGYQPLFLYEKYRMTYVLESTNSPMDFRQQAVGLQNCHIMLDKLPYGNFVEIEGETLEVIQAVSHQLHLTWDTAIATSYHALFDRAQKTLNLPFQDLSFEKFAGVKVTPADLGVDAADVAM